MAIKKRFYFFFGDFQIDANLCFAKSIHIEIDDFRKPKSGSLKLSL